MAIALSAVAILAAYASAFLPQGAPWWAPWAFVAGTSLMMVATMAVGASRNGHIGRLWLPLGLVMAVLMAGFGAVLVLPPSEAGGSDLWLGLPPRAAIILYVVGFIPYLLVPVAYAWTFNELTLRPGELERIRERALEARGTMPLDRREGS